MGIEKEINQIVDDYQAGQLARTLMGRIRQIPTPSPEDGKAIGMVLADIAGDLPVRQAMWIAFWLGCAWDSLHS